MKKYLFALLLLCATPLAASAHDDWGHGGYHDRGHHYHGRGYWWNGRYYVTEAQPVYYYPPNSVIVAPAAPVYYAPPAPVYYAPQPLVSFGVNLGR